jgi:KDO2-lipid IV(A) lauroyltransferase
MPESRPQKKRRRLKARLKPWTDPIVGRLAMGLFRVLQRGDLDRWINRTARLQSRIGPYRSEHQIGRDNLVAAFPEKSQTEIDEILHGVWQNVGRFGTEFANLDRLWDYDPSGERPSRVEVAEADRARISRVRDSGKPVLFIGGHLGNWELSACCLHAHGLDLAVLYRPPNLRDVANVVQDMRSKTMGQLIATGPRAAMQAAMALRRGASVGMLVDQNDGSGIEVEFFGRRCKTNQMIARLARQFGCPIHGSRVIRLPGNRFRVEFTDPLDPPRNADGRIDVLGTTQQITSVIEGWVREYPDQWLWLHRRWR